MSEERKYLEHKKKTIIDLVNKYNSTSDKEHQFEIDEENLDISKIFCFNSCKGCGKCCGSFPCVYSPRDFLDITDLDYMRRILDTGVVSIVRYNNNYPLIIRNRGVLDEDSIACGDIDTINPCILFGKNGCALSDVYRSSQGLLFVIEKQGHTSLYSKREYLKEYSNIAYQDALDVLYDEYKDVVIPKPVELIFDEKKRVASPKEPMNEENVKKFVNCLINKKISNKRS